MRVRAVLISLLAASVVTSACASTSDRVTEPTAVGAPDAAGSTSKPTAGTCDPAGVQWAIGEKANEALLERARVAAHAGTARFLRPNERITMEYSGSRLNLQLNDQDVVRAVTCG